MPLLSHPAPLLRAVVEEIISTEAKLTKAHNGLTVSVHMAPEPFLNPFAHSKGGAYPHEPRRPVNPGSLGIMYEIDETSSVGELRRFSKSTNINAFPFLIIDPIEQQQAFRDLAIGTMHSFSHAIQSIAVELGVSSFSDILYPNYALGDTPLKLMYGSNIEKLRKVAKKFDPRGVMRLCGGPKF